MNDIVPLLVGLGLIAFATFLIRWHFRAWHAHQADATIDERELRYYRFQFRRRLFISALLVLLGVLIPAGDALMMQAQRRLPALIAGYWMLVLSIALLIMLLALIDLAAGNAHRRATLGAIQGLARKRRELEAEVARLRAEHRNGSG